MQNNVIPENAKSDNFAQIFTAAPTMDNSNQQDLEQDISKTSTREEKPNDFQCSLHLIKRKETEVVEDNANVNNKGVKKSIDSAKIIERIVSISRLKELKSAVKNIVDDDVTIIEGLYDAEKKTKRGS